MSEKVTAYLSHARDEKDLSPVARGLVNYFSDQGAELLNDTDEDRINRSVNGFVECLTRSSVVIFLLNERFFNRHWCVYELTEHFSKTEYPEYHSVYVLTESWLSGVTNVDAELRTTFAAQQHAHWQKFVNESQDDKHRQLGGKIISGIRDVLKFISGRDLYWIEDSDEDFEKLLDHVTTLDARHRNSITSRCTDNYKSICEKQVARFLATWGSITPDLCSALDLDANSSADLISSQLINVFDPITRLDNCRHALNSHLERVKKSKLEINKISQFIGLMIATVVQVEESDTEYAHETPVFDLTESDEFSASLFVSRLQDKLGTDLKIDGGKLIAVGEYAAGYKETNHSDVVTGHKINLWNYEFEGMQLPEDDKELIARLNRRMRNNFVDGKPRYLIVNANSELNNIDLLSALKADFPYLFIFRTGISSSGIRVLPVELSEVPLQDILGEFDNILNEYLE